MATRFDGERLTLELAVADLLEGGAQRHLGFANRGGYERLWLGQAIHSRYQEEALAGDGSYRREVALSISFGHRGWEITVHGRADGLRRDPDGTLVVEEIKSVRRGGGLAPAVRDLYEQQARLYAWMLARREGVPVRAELVLIEIGGDGGERIEVDVPVAAIEAGVRRRLNALIHSFESARMAAMARREAGERLAFPYGALRPGQEEIVAAVETALEHREHLLLQAPTGIGKTVAALFPALKHCLAHDKRLFVLTAKTTQQEMARTVLALLNREGAFRSLTLRAKAKMCANGEVICHEEYCGYARDYYSKLGSSQVLSRLMAENPSLDPETVYDQARAAEVCPFEVSLELAGRVQVVVCDYNYVFDPYVGLSEFHADEDLSDTVLVVDELHNLVDRGRGYHSPTLDADAARRAAEATAAGGGAAIHRHIADLLLRIAGRIEEVVVEALGELPGQPPRVGDGGTRAIETALPEDELFIARRELDAAFVDYLEHNRDQKSFRADDRFVAFYFDYLRFLNGLAVSDDAFSHCAERAAPEGGFRHGRTGARLRVLCKDPSRFLGAVIERTHSTIGLSATLSPPELYRDLLGFGRGRTAAVAVPSPFPAENRRVVIDASVATTWRERPSYTRRIAERLAAFADAVPGNCLALFPSYGFLAQVAGAMPPVAKRILVQQSGSGDGERDLILDALRRSLFGDVLLLAVAGGVFAEGVDYPGEALKAVAVVGPCLPALSLEQQLLRAFYDERFDRGFEYAYVVPGMTRVVQAAGRLIRSAEDVGVIALLDRRFLERPYRDHLPPEWLPEEGAGALAGDPAEAAADFFAIHGAAPGAASWPTKKSPRREAGR